MDIVDILPTDAVVTGISVTSKKHLLQELSKRICRLTEGLNEREIFDILLQRERLGSTGVGNGVAIPHGRLDNLDRSHGFFIRLDKPVDFDAIDDKPVDLIFLLLAPEGAGADHLKALARVTRLFRDKDQREKLRGTEDPEAIYALLIDKNINHAA